MTTPVRLTMRDHSHLFVHRPHHEVEQAITRARRAGPTIRLDDRSIRLDHIFAIRPPGQRDAP